MAREALYRGKKVICEKPLFLSDSNITIDGPLTPVLQLRYHPGLAGLEARDVQVEAKMFRDDVYWNSWKGNQTKSGGVLYNLGVHYIDLLTVLLGKPEEVMTAIVTDKVASGRIRFERGYGNFHIEIVSDRAQQGRKVTVDGKEINLSNQDNLSYEDLHKEVYKDFIMGKGFSVEQAQVSLDLIEDIIKVSTKNGSQVL
jgi:UDP-N-acetyl-2-amino-2-deoxyglucuronate dehydrogenase